MLANLISLLQEVYAHKTIWVKWIYRFLWWKWPPLTDWIIFFDWSIYRFYEEYVMTLSSQKFRFYLFSDCGFAESFGTHAGSVLVFQLQLSGKSRSLNCMLAICCVATLHARNCRNILVFVETAGITTGNLTPPQSNFKINQSDTDSQKYRIIAKSTWNTLIFQFYCFILDSNRNGCDTLFPPDKLLPIHQSH